MPELERIIEAIPADVVNICRRLRENGNRGWVVGGCVRDLLRGAPAKDWDVATDALPQEVTKQFRKVIPTGIEHGTVTVLIDHVPYEVTTLRGEGEYVDGRRPEDVVFLDDIEQDLARRDFTFNAIAIDPIDRKMIDPFGGRDDLEARVLRAVGVPLKRFCEDGLRILRATRFAAVMPCSIETKTLEAMQHPDALATLAKVSAERKHDEWLKTMSAKQPSVGFALMQSIGVMDLICPELEAGVEPAWAATMRAVDACPDDAVLRIAALLHRLDADVADAVLRRLKFSKEHIRRIATLVRHHDIGYETDWDDAHVRRWLRGVTRDRLDDVCTLAMALAESGADERRLEGTRELHRRAKAQLGAALESRELSIGGKDLMSELGLSPSKRLGNILSALLERVLDDPALNQREMLLEMARAYDDEQSGTAS
jgi:tRNA nucleotidyltransferase (CCA-adding enzyme)